MAAPRSTYLRKYSPAYLLNLRYFNRWRSIDACTVLCLKYFRIFKSFNRKRGSRGGRLRYPINVKSTYSISLCCRNRPSPHRLRSVNYNNLIGISTLSHVYDYPKIMFSNIRSLHNKYDQLQISVEANCPDIAIFVESWLRDEDVNAFGIVNYSHLYRLRNRPDRHHGGGISLYVRNKFSVMQFSTSESPFIEVLTVMCRPPMLPRNVPWFAFIVVYFPPNDVYAELLSAYIASEIDRLLSVNLNGAIYVVGDFNNFDTSCLQRRHDFVQIFKDSNRGNKVLSKCFSNVKFDFSVLVAPAIASSDHLTILIIPKQHSARKPEIREVLLRSKKKSNFSIMAKALQSFDWSCWKLIVDPQFAADFFYRFLHYLTDLAFPITAKLFNDHQHPWISNDIVKLIGIRQSMFRDPLALQSNINVINYKIKSSIRAAKSKFCASLLQSANQSPSDFFKIINESVKFKNDSRECDRSGLVFDGLDLETTNIRIIEYFKKLLNSHVSVSAIADIYVAEDGSDIAVMSEQSVFSQLLKLKIKSRESPCELPSFIYRDFAEFLADPIAHLINLSVSLAYVPIQWKSSYLIPLPKSKIVSSPHQIRPICISSSLSKICERFIMVNVISSIHSSFDHLQFGGLPKRSVSQYLAIYCHKVLQHLESQDSSVCTLITDFAKAFDNVSHVLLIQSLHDMGVPLFCIRWIISFLDGRRIILKNGNCGKLSNISDLSVCANSFTISNGLPQGSVLGSLLFAIFVNDMASQFENRLKFVDDLSVSIMLRNSNDLQAQFHLLPQSVFNSILLQADDLRIPLNTSKCLVLFHSFSKNISYPTIQVNGVNLPIVSSTKILGIVVQSNLKWDLMVDLMIKKANKCLYILYALRRMKASCVILIKCYITYIRPFLEYGAPVWCASITQKQANDIESVQKRVCRIILGCNHISYLKDLSILKLVSLSSRRGGICKNFAISFSRSFPQYLPSARGDISGRITRQSGKIDLPRCRTVRFKNSPIYAVCNILNNL